ncbi:MAG: PRC-barrel domain-containing protein [Alphaproteobacteria bacterium]
MLLRYLGISAMALTVGMAAAHAEDADEALETCRAALNDYQSELAADGMAPAPLARGDMRLLREAALVFARAGNEEGCTDVVEGMRELAEERQEQMAEAAEETDADAPEARLQAAVPVASTRVNLRASDMIGAEVVNPQGEDLGTVEDIVVAQNGARYLLISRGGVLGIGEDWVPVSMERVRVTEDGETFVIAVDPERLDGAPTDSEIDLEDSDGWTADVDAWWEANIEG